MPHPTSALARRRDDPRRRTTQWPTNPARGLPLAAALSALLTTGGVSHDTAVAQIVVRNALESGWTTTSPWTLEEDSRLWGPPGGHLGMVLAVATDSRDNIYILDYMTQEIHVFDSEIGFLRTVGGPGDGPGEFRDALGPAIGPGDTMWVADQRAPRYSIFGPAGTFIGTRTRRGASSGGSFTERCTMTPDGEYMEWWTRYPKEERTGDMSDIDLVHFHPLRVSPHRGAQDTLPPLEFTQRMADMPSLGMRRPVWFGPQLRRALGCHGDIWFASSGEYRLFRRSLEGDTTLIATLDGVAAEDIDETDRDEIRAMFERRPNPALVADYLRTLPDTKPIIAKIFVDGAGHVFVIPETSRVDVGTVIDVFREDGAFIGRMAVPDSVRVNPEVVYATADYILFAGEDDAGTPYVTRLGIRR